MRSTTAKNGTRRCAAATNIRLTWRTWACVSISGPTMKPGRVDQRDERQAVRVAQLHEARRLVGRVGVDRAAEVRRVVGEQADRPAFDARERGEDADAEAGAQLEQRAGVGDAVASPRACRRRAARFSGSTSRSACGSAASQVGEPALEVARGSASRPRTASASSSTSTSITPLRDCTSLGPISSGRERRRARRLRPSPGRPCRCCCPRVAMITSQQPSSAALPAKQRPATMPTTGTWPLSRAKLAKVVTCRPATTGHVGVARPAAAAFGEQHHRQLLLAARCRAGGRSSGGCACPACRRARWRRRPSRRSATRSAPNSVAVDAADAGDHAVGRRVARSGRRACGGCVCAATASAPYSMKLPASHRSAMFSRAVRRPSAWRLATASGRAASSVSAWRSSGSLQVGAQASLSSAAGTVGCRGRRCRRSRAALRARTSRSPSRPARPPGPALRAPRPRPTARTSCSIFIASRISKHLPRPHRLAGGDQHGDDGAGHRCVDPAHRA